MKEYKYQLFLKNGELEKEIKTNDLNYIRRFRNKLCDDSGTLYARYFNCKENINDKELYFYGL